MSEKWAVCPNPDYITGNEKPRLFDNESSAKRFLNSKAALGSPEDAAILQGITVEAVRINRAAMSRERAKILQEIRSGARSPLSMPHSFRQRRNRDIWRVGPIPVIGLEPGGDPLRSIRDFLTPDQLAPIPDQSISGILERVFKGTLPEPTCLLGLDWKFEALLDDAIRRVGHEFEGLKHASITEIILKAVYDLESALFAIHPSMSGAALSQFWTSWNVQRHIAEFSHSVSQSGTVRLLAHNPTRDADASRDFMKIRLAVYAHEIRPRSAVASPPKIFPPRHPKKPETHSSIRFTGVVHSPTAARRTEVFIRDNNMTVTQFAGMAGTTDRTLRSFRSTGKVRHDVFNGIARAMKTTRENLLESID